METTPAQNRIAERKLHDRQARRAQIISVARRIAEIEGWPNVTVRRLSDEISYSQPVLYPISEAAKEFSLRLLSKAFTNWALLWKRQKDVRGVAVR
jgi:hypothetical protein